MGLQDRVHPPQLDQFLQRLLRRCCERISGSLHGLLLTLRRTTLTSLIRSSLLASVIDRLLTAQVTPVRSESATRGKLGHRAHLALRTTAKAGHLSGTLHPSP